MIQPLLNDSIIIESHLKNLRTLHLNFLLLIIPKNVCFRNRYSFSILNLQYSFRKSYQGNGE